MHEVIKGNVLWKYKNQEEIKSYEIVWMWNPKERVLHVTGTSTVEGYM